MTALARIAEAAGVDVDVARRVLEAADSEAHGTTATYWGCAAHSEGQTCCVELMLEKDSVEPLSDGKDLTDGDD